MSQFHDTLNTVSQFANQSQGLSDSEFSNPFQHSSQPSKKRTNNKTNTQKSNNLSVFAYDASAHLDLSTSAEDTGLLRNRSDILPTDLGDSNTTENIDTIFRPSEIVNFSKREKFLAYFVEDFHPIWFVSTMGTGITSSVLYNFPVESSQHVLKYFGVIFFFLNIFLFILTNTLFLLKYLIFAPRFNTSFGRLLTDPTECFFLGCQPMGLCTLINMTYYTTLSFEGDWIYFVYTLWWVNVGLTIMSAWGISYIMFSNMNLNNHSLNAVILLPVVPLTVCASTGQVILPGLTSESWKLSSMIITYILWANAIFFAVPFISIYFNKLMLFKLPPKKMIFSGFIPVGIMGQGAYSILLMSENLSNMIQESGVHSILPGYSGSFFSQEKIEIMVVLIKLGGACAGLFLLAFGLCLTAIAIMKILTYGLAQRFSKAWWAMTFPLGTMSNGFNQLHKITDITGFKVMAIIYGIGLIGVTITCLVMSFIIEFPHAAWKDLLFARKRGKSSDIYSA